MSGTVPGEGRTGAVRPVFRPGSVPVWPGGRGCIRPLSTPPTSGCGPLPGTSTCDRPQSSSPSRTPPQPVCAHAETTCIRRAEWYVHLSPSVASEPRAVWCMFRQSHTKSLVSYPLSAPTVIHRCSAPSEACRGRRHVPTYRLPMRSSHRPPAPAGCPSTRDPHSTNAPPCRALCGPAWHRDPSSTRESRSPCALHESPPRDCVRRPPAVDRPTPSVGSSSSTPVRRVLPPSASWPESLICLALTAPGGGMTPSCHPLPCAASVLQHPARGSTSDINRWPTGWVSVGHVTALW